VTPPRPFARLSSAGGAPIALYAGDAVRLLGDVVPPHGADVVVTSPPYNRGMPYGAYDDGRPRAEYLAWVRRVADRVRGALAPQGSFFLNVGGAPTDPFLPWDVARVVADGGLVLQNVIHWIKSIAIDRDAAGRSAGLDRALALGHYKPVRGDRFLHGAQEYVFHFTPSGRVPLDRLAIGVPYQDKSNVTRWGSAADRRCRGNTWFLPYGTIRFAARDRPHPASFPESLPDRCYRLHGLDRIRLAVDPFVGIGPSAVAAARLDLPFVGIDVDREYLAVARAAVGRAGARASPGRHPASRPAGPASRALSRDGPGRSPREP